MIIKDRVENIDIAQFEKACGVLQDTKWLLVVKSQNQNERRKSLLATKEGGQLGRIKPRPTATGLLVSGGLKNGHFEVEWQKKFREPRHIKQLPSGDYLLTEMNRVLRVSASGGILNSYHHPFFGFLHTVDLHPDGGKALFASSGYDTVIELDMESGNETFRWIAWDHGFNPDGDGYWLAADQATHDKYRSQGKKTLLIDPDEYGEQGLVTARRSAHPNAAVYDVYNDAQSIIVSIGHGGDLYRVSLSSGETEKICAFLSQMPHGLMAFNEGWIITNTTQGEWWWMDSKFNPKTCYSVSQMGGKVIGTENVEWLQQVVPASNGQALFLDANRGLLAIDYANSLRTVYQPAPEWCIQDALLVDR